MIAITLAILLSTLAPPRLELDHVFIVVTAGAQPEIAALRAAGLTVSQRVQKHDGQGTASVAAFFANAYLELIWVDSSVSVDDAHRTSLAWFRSATAWRTSGTSPFGIGLRRVDGDTAQLNVPVIREPAPWLAPDQAFELLRQTTEVLAADLFVVPPMAAVPTWVQTRRQRVPELFVHAQPATEITAIRVHGAAAQHPASLHLLKPARVAIVTDSVPLLEVILDGGKQGRRTDLRPLMPVLLVR